MDEDSVLRNRLAVDDKLFKRLFKKVLQNDSEETLLLEGQLFLCAVKKLVCNRKKLDEERNRYDTEAQNSERQLVESHEKIETLKKQLEKEIENVGKRKQYNEIVKQISEYPSNSVNLKVIDCLKKEILDLEEESNKYQELIEKIQEEIETVVLNIHSLQKRIENVNKKYHFKSFGSIISSDGQVVSKDNNLVYASALEDVLLWNLRHGICEKTFRDPEIKNAHVTCIRKSLKHLAIGYSDGSIRVYDINSTELCMTLKGHRSAVTALTFSNDELLLASGGKDCDIVMWDLLEETGLYRLVGHKGVITGLIFKDESTLLSCSKDMLIKLWNLETKYCQATVCEHVTEITCMALSEDSNYLLTGGQDQEMKMFNAQNEIKYVGSIVKQSKERVIQVQFCGSFVLVQSNDKTIEVFRRRNEKEIAKKLKRKKKRLEDKGKQMEEVQYEVSDEFDHLTMVRCSSRIKSFDTIMENGVSFVTVGLSNNTIEQYRLSASKEEKTLNVNVDLTHQFNRLGHSSDVRALAISSDDLYIATVSQESIRIWSSAAAQLIRVFPCDYGLSVVFVPGDQQVIVGTKQGHLLIVDINSATVFEIVDAHSGPIWGIQVLPSKKGIVSGSGDKSIRFWDFELLQDDTFSLTSRRLSLALMRTLQCSDEVLSLCVSPDGKLIALSLLDSTVKVFFVDTLSFYLSLYGHRLPVMSLDISSDNTMIVSGSADKTIKIWGLDFGDCHKSLLAHKEGVMRVQFIKGTHYVFTSSKDGTIKHWDADRFELIQTLTGHHSQVWAMAVSRHGHFVLSGSNDRSIRLWQRSDEQIFLEEEREKELDKMFDHVDIIDKQTNAANLRTEESLKAGEKIIEALDIVREEKVRTDGQSHPLIVLYKVACPEEYIFKVISGISSSSLDDALLVLPFNYVVELFDCLTVWSDRNWNLLLCQRIWYLLVQIHQKQIMFHSLMKKNISRLESSQRQKFSDLKSKMEINLAALNFVSEQWQIEHESSLFADEMIETKLEELKQKAQTQLKRKVVIS